MAIYRAIRKELATLEELAEVQQHPFLDAELPEILLLHGFLLSTNSLQGLAVSLQKSYEVARVEYPSFRNLEQTARDLTQKVKEITDAREEAISLVGHSMGGLIATRVAQEYPAGVKKVVALGTPFHGTYVAYLETPFRPVLAIPSVQQMLPGSDFLKELRERGFPASVQFVSIYSRDDLIVRPWKSSQLPEAENTSKVQLSGVGHLGLVGEKVYRKIKEALDK